MAVHLSIIVPVLNEAAALAQTLEPLQDWRGSATIEIIVADGGSCDDTLAVARPLADTLVCATAGRAAQMNAGAEAAQGDYLLFLHADTQLPPQWPQLLQAWREDRVSWGYFALRFTGRGPALRVLAWFINARSRLTGVSTGDQCQFVRRSLFVDVGGFAALPLMEDVALSKCLRRRQQPRFETRPVTTSSRRWESKGLVRTVLLMWSLRLAYVCGVSPARLAAIYYPRRNAVNATVSAD
mgnify:CR=1 FL=1